MPPGNEWSCVDVCGYIICENIPYTLEYIEYLLPMNIGSLA